MLSDDFTRFPETPEESPDDAPTMHPHPIPNPYPPHKHHAFMPPRLTLQEQFLDTYQRVNETIDRVLRMESHIRKRVDDFISNITADNVAFKDLCIDTYNQFAQTVHTEVNTFEADILNAFESFKGDYANLLASVDGKLDEFRDSVEGRLEKWNETYINAFNDFRNEINEKISTTENRLDTAYEAFVDEVNADIAEFKNNWTATIDDRLDAQDAKINDIDLYFRTNFSATIENMINDLRESGELDEIIADGLDDVGERLTAIESHTVTPGKFGAVGDGVTDDSLALQATLDYCAEHNATLNGQGKVYCVGSPIEVPAEIHPNINNKGVHAYGNVKIENINLFIKDDVDALVPALIVIISDDNNIILDGVTINGNSANQGREDDPSSQNTGRHGIYATGKDENANGVLTILNSSIYDCYTDGICFSCSTQHKATLVMDNCKIRTAGRNGITDNFYNSYIYNSVICDNGTRTAPKNGYHIEPDHSTEFGEKYMLNTTVQNNGGDRNYKIHLNSNEFTINKISVNNCNLESFGIAAHCVNSAVKRLEFNNSVIGGFGFSVNDLDVNNIVVDSILFNSCRMGATISLSQHKCKKLAFNNCDFISTTGYIKPGGNFECIEISGANVILDDYVQSDTYASAFLFIGEYKIANIKRLTIQNSDIRGIGRLTRMANSSVIEEFNLFNNIIDARIAVIHPGGIRSDTIRMIGNTFERVNGTYAGIIVASCPVHNVIAMFNKSPVPMCISTNITGATHIDFNLIGDTTVEGEETT